LRLKLLFQREFTPPIEFKPLVPELIFIKNKTKWGLSLKGRAMIEIPKRDYNIIVRSASSGPS
jgi:predicted RNA-binding protein